MDSMARRGLGRSAKGRRGRASTKTEASCASRGNERMERQNLQGGLSGSFSFGGAAPGGGSTGGWSRAQQIPLRSLWRDHRRRSEWPLAHTLRLLQYHGICIQESKTACCAGAAGQAMPLSVITGPISGELFARAGSTGSDLRIFGPGDHVFISAATVKEYDRLGGRGKVGSTGPEAAITIKAATR